MNLFQVNEVEVTETPNNDPARMSAAIGLSRLSETDHVRSMSFNSFAEQQALQQQATQEQRQLQQHQQLQEQRQPRINKRKATSFGGGGQPVKRKPGRYGSPFNSVHFSIMWILDLNGREK